MDGYRNACEEEGMYAMSSLYVLCWWSIVYEDENELGILSR
jgi:hypothetical protein